MTLTSQKIIFFGTEDYSLGALRTLVNNGFAVAAVITKPDAPRGRGQKLTAPPVKTFALEHSIPVWQPQKLGDLADDIRNLQPVAGVLVAYGKIIPQSMFDLFTPGIVNIHPSLLPLYRGPSPIESAIVNRDAQTGVTIMKLEAGMDSGPIYAQETLELKGQETNKELYATLFKIGEQMLIDTLPKILSGKLHPTPQDHDQATYCSLLSKNDSELNPTSITAAEAEAHVRAYLGFPRSRITVANRNLIITSSHISDVPEHQLSIRFNDGRYLTIDRLIAPSGKTVSSEEYLRGYPI